MTGEVSVVFAGPATVDATTDAVVVVVLVITDGSFEVLLELK